MRTEVAETMKSHLAIQLLKEVLKYYKGKVMSNNFSKSLF